MRRNALWYSILKVPRCGIHSFSFLESTYVGSLTESLLAVRTPFALLGISNGFEASQVHAFQARHISAGTNIKGGEPSNHRNEFLDGILKENTQNYRPVSSSCFTSIQYSDAEPKILEKGDSKQKVKVFVMDIETTGFYRERERIIEIAIRDLSGDKNGCFQTLVNPERHVLNSHIHGITTKMVNRTYVPRYICCKLK